MPEITPLVSSPWRMTPLRAAVATACMAFALAATSEEPFVSENEAAMQKMMADMHVKRTGDVDRDFVAMMIPHHQGAIDMARAELRYGRNEQLQQIAREIVDGQQHEIVAMRSALDPAAPPAAAAPAVRRDPFSAANAGTR